MEKLKRIFKTIRKDFHDFVPPLTVKVDQEHHYEVWAINEGVANLFGKIVLHSTYVELTFYSTIDIDQELELFQIRLFKYSDHPCVRNINRLTPC